MIKSCVADRTGDWFEGRKASKEKEGERVKRMEAAEGDAGGRVNDANEEDVAADDDVEADVALSEKVSIDDGCRWTRKKST